MKTICAILSVLAGCVLGVEPRPCRFPWTATVVAVQDGDTITVLAPEGNALRVRVYGVDAPETYPPGQPGGVEAKEFVARLLPPGTPVTIRVRDVDRYGRLDAEVRIPNLGQKGEVDLSAELVRAGHAWWYSRYAPDRTDLRELERTARASRVGLWTGTPEPPWLWRRAHPLTGHAWPPGGAYRPDNEPGQAGPE